MGNNHNKRSKCHKNKNYVNRVIHKKNVKGRPSSQPGSQNQNLVSLENSITVDFINNICDITSRHKINEKCSLKVINVKVCGTKHDFEIFCSHCQDAVTVSLIKELVPTGDIIVDASDEDENEPFVQIFSDNYFLPLANLDTTETGLEGRVSTWSPHPGTSELDKRATDVSTLKICTPYSSQANFRKAGKRNNCSRFEDEIQGRRVVSTSFLKKLIIVASEHTSRKSCTSLSLYKETWTGLSSTFHLYCPICQIEPIKLKTDGMDQCLSLPINNAIAWGTAASGGGYQSFIEQATVLDLPGLNARIYRSNELLVYQQQKKALIEKMNANGILEKDLATTFVNNVPAIGVIVDGGWGKRSYGHSYNSLSGLAAIFGVRTGGLLFLGIRNKFCYICDSQTHNSNGEKRSHLCFKNWTGSSNGMETDIICEGFMNSLTQHGMYYTSMTGDGDSSVYPAVLDKMRAKFGIHVEKVECVNHAISRLKTNLYKLCGQTRSYNLDARKLVKSQISRLGYGAKSAIIHNSMTTGCNHSTLANDLRNGPFHTFGCHKNCKDYFCKRKGTTELDHVPMLSMDPLWGEMLLLFNRLAGLSKSLILNQKSNAAESFMSLYAKSSGGKRKNLYQKHGYTLRATMAGNSHKEGANSHYVTYKNAFKKSPSSIWKTRYVCSKSKSITDTARNKVRRKLALKTPTRETACPGSEHYGSEVKSLDMPEDVLKLACNDFLISKRVNKEQIDNLAKRTVGQSENPLWVETRRHTITTTKFHKILHKRPGTSTSKIVESIIYPKHWGRTPKPLQHGIDNESLGRKLYSEINNVKIDETGIILDSTGMLGYSPDGLISDGSDGLLEIKCPYSAFISDKDSILASVEAGIIEFLDNKEGVIFLKQSHEYYTQIIGQLGISGRKYCDLFVFIPATLRKSSSDVYSRSALHQTVRILPNPVLWSSMKCELERFYITCLLPEIVDPRTTRSMPIRDTTFVVSSQFKQLFKDATEKIPRKRKALANLNTIQPSHKIDRRKSKTGQENIAIGSKFSMVTV